MEFTIKECRFQISFWFAAVICLWLCVDSYGTFLAGMAAALLHEIGHVIAILFCKRKVTYFRLSAFGAEIEQADGGNGSLQKDCLIYLLGPFANIVCFFLFWLFTGNLLHPFCVANLALGLINLIPAEPLDGGQAVYSLLCIRYDEETAIKILERLSFVVLTPLAICGFLLLFQSAYNFSLLFFSIYGIFFLLLKKRERL